MEGRALSSTTVWFAGGLVEVRVQAAQSGGRLGAWESHESGGDRLPLHVHTREDEQVLLLEGTLTFHVGEGIHHLAAGDTLALPREVPHAHVVTSPTARILTIATPGGFERLFTEFGVPALPNTTAPALDAGALNKAAAHFGVRVVGPPPAIEAP